MLQKPGTEGSPPATRYSLPLLLAAIAVVLSPLFSLSYFHKGVFFQSEPVSIGLSLALAVAALALALRAQLSQIPVRYSSPVLIAGSFALVSLLLAVFHQHGARSLLGSLEFGDGAVSFVWLAVSIATGHSLFRWRLTRWLLASAMLALTLFLLVTKALGPQLPGLQVLGFNDYLALYMVPLAFVYLALSRSWGVRARLTGMLVTGGLILCLAWLSDSRASFAVLLGMLIAWLLISVTQRWYLVRWPVISIVVLVTSAMVGTLMTVCYIGLQVAPEGITKLPAVVQSIWSRYQLASIAMTALSSDPSAWLTGLGWGSFRDFLVLYGPGQEGVQFYFYKQDVLATNWDSLNRLTGHSHNVYLESLLAIGLLGPVLWVVFLSSIARAIRGNARPAVLALLLGHIFLTSIWFLLPMALGFFGLAVGMLLAAAEDGQPLEAVPGNTPVIPSGIAAVIGYAVASTMLFTTTAYAWHKASYGERLMASSATPNIRDAQGNCGDVNGIPLDGEYSGRALLSVASLLGARPAASVATPKQQAQTNEIREWFARLVCISAADLGNAPSHFLRYARLQSRYLLSVSGRVETGDVRMRAFWSDWPAELEAFARLGSAREDLVLAYVTRLFEYNKTLEILAFCDPNVAQVGRGAACQLFRGMVLVNTTESRHAGQSAIRRAIEAGIKKFMVLPPSFYKKYLSSSAMDTSQNS